MAAQDQRDDTFLRGLFDAYLQRAKGLSEYLMPGSGGKKLTDEEVNLAWNERAVSIEDEWELWRIGRAPESAARGERPLTPEEIAVRVYPKREKLAKAAGRVTPREVTMWVNQYAKTQQRKLDEMPAMAEGEPSDAY